MKIGITGNYASGKGTVCSFFKELGAEIIDTDIVSRECVLPGSPLLNEISRIFGADFIDSDGTLKRRELAVSVFSDTDKTKKLNDLIHPEIIKRVNAMCSLQDQIYVINAPLLFEANLHTFMDFIITVSIPENKSIRRGILRDNLTENEIKLRLSRQISLKEKEERSDYVIDNSGNLENTKRQVVEIWNKIFSKNQI